MNFSFDEEAIPETLQPLLSDAKKEKFIEALGACSIKRKELMQAVAAKAKGLDSKNWPTYFGGLETTAVHEWLFKSSPAATLPAGGKKPKKAMTGVGDLATPEDGSKFSSRSNVRVGDGPTL
jgi:hypothetical protein